jgi:hypothetical protein
VEVPGALFAMRLIFALTILFLSIFASPAGAEKRVALVVGNADYSEIQFGSLPNSRRDAQLIADALAANGFTLVGGGVQLDLDRPTLVEMIATFSTKPDTLRWQCFIFLGME